MSDIVEAVAKAIEEALIADATGGGYASSNGGGFVTVDYEVDTSLIARAAIEAYEDAKMRDLLSGVLVQKVNADGRIEHVDRQAMINTWEGRER